MDRRALKVKANLSVTGVNKCSKVINAHSYDGSNC